MDGLALSLVAGEASLIQKLKEEPDNLEAAVLIRCYLCHDLKNECLNVEP